MLVIWKNNQSDLQICAYSSSDSSSSMLSVRDRFNLCARAWALSIIDFCSLTARRSAPRASFLVMSPQFCSENWNGIKLTFPDVLLRVTGSLTLIFPFLSTSIWHSPPLSKTRPHWIYLTCQSTFVKVESITDLPQLHRGQKFQISHSCVLPMCWGKGCQGNPWLREHRLLQEGSS